MITIDVEKGSSHEYLVSPADFLMTVNGKKYLVDAKLGQGGNAVVYECYRGDTADTDDKLAVKFLYNTGTKAKNRFKQEIDLLCSVSHPHLIKYYDHGSILMKTRNSRKEIDYLIMEKADKSLNSFLREEWSKGIKSKIGFEVYFQQFLGMSDALGELHRHAIHRDIKPDNILICGDAWKISDFGLCSFIGKRHKDLTKEYEKVGPELWLSPEAINSRLLGKKKNKANTSSDVFQFAEVIWYVVNKRHPQGIVTESDWTGPSGLFPIVRDSLLNNNTKRITNGSMLFDKLLSVAQ